MDESRYGKPPAWHRFALGLPPAIVMLVMGGYWTLLSWGVIGDEESTFFSIVGPLLAGLGVALGFVTVRGRPDQGQ